MSGRKVAVIGAGLAGLSCAIRLASRGFTVDVFERQSFPGGKAGEKKIGGYRFDTGPSLLTLIDVFDDLFSSVGKNREDYFTVEKLSPLCSYFLSDGTFFQTSSYPEKLEAEVASKTKDGEESVRSYLQHCNDIYSLAAPLFLHKSLHETATYRSRDALQALLQLWKIDPLRTMDTVNNVYFKDPRMVQLFNRYATYNGSSPYLVPATLLIIPYVEYCLGGYGVVEGIYAVPKALEALAKELGVTVSYNTNVDRILYSDNGRRKITGIRINGEKLDYPIVITNADVKKSYKELLEDPKARYARRYDRLEPSSSGVVFYWGVGRSFEQLTLHNIIFSSDYKKEFADLFNDMIVPEEPTIYINITSKLTERDAPPGGENWFVLINAPPNRGQDWEKQVIDLRGRVIERISKRLGCDIESEIEAEEIMTPVDIERNTGSSYGSLYGISSNTRQAAFLRHPNRVKRYRGLYFCGGSAHPGGGMPLAILSGKITSELVEQYENNL